MSLARFMTLLHGAIRALAGDRGLMVGGTRPAAFAGRRRGCSSGDAAWPAAVGDGGAQRTGWRGAEQVDTPDRKGLGDGRAAPRWDRGPDSKRYERARPASTAHPIAGAGGGNCSPARSVAARRAGDGFRLLPTLC